MLKSKQNMEANCKHGSYSTQQRQYNKKKADSKKFSSAKVCHFTFVIYFVFCCSLGFIMKCGKIRLFWYFSFEKCLFCMRL